MIEIAAIPVFKKAKVSRSDVESYIAALNKHFVNDFGPVWGVTKHYTLYPDLKSVPDGLPWHMLEDDADQAGELGVHELTDEGLPVEHVFVNTSLEDGASWTVCGCHEADEAGVDPDCNLCVEVVINRKLYLVGYETNDAVEDDSFGYPVDGVLMSDFQYPSYFVQTGRQGRKLDHGGFVTKPLEILKGGYLGAKLQGHGSGQWIQLTKAESPMQTHSVLPFLSNMQARRYGRGKRLAKRNAGRANWKLSSPSVRGKTVKEIWIDGMAPQEPGE